MSVVAYKAGVLAADSKAYGGAYQSSPGTKRKVHRLADGSRVGITTSVLGQAERFVEWMNKGADRTAWGEGKPDIRALWVKANGEVYLADDGLDFSGPIDCESYAIGSGAPYAIGAMAHGATAAEAVRIACLHDPHCGGHVIVLEATDG